MIHPYEALLWCDIYNTYFVQLDSVFVTVTLHFPTSHYRYVPQFALRFPDLKIQLSNLYETKYGYCQGHQVPLAITKSPPLCGHLRRARTDEDQYHS